MIRAVTFYNRSPIFNFVLIIALRFGQVPVLEVDGKTIAQSMSIARFLARRYKLAGKNELEEAEADMIVGFMEDAFSGNLTTMLIFCLYSHPTITLVLALSCFLRFRFCGMPPGR